MLKLIHRLFIIVGIICLLLLIYLSVTEACDRWVLEGSMNNTGSKYSSGVFNLCYYQDLNGSGQTLKMRLPTHKECPTILDPCPEGGSDTTVTVNQDSGSRGSTYEPSTASPARKIEWEVDYKNHLNGKMSLEDFNSKWIGYGIYR